MYYLQKYIKKYLVSLEKSLDFYNKAKCYKYDNFKMYVYISNYYSNRIMENKIKHWILRAIFRIFNTK